MSQQFVERDVFIIDRQLHLSFGSGAGNPRRPAGFAQTLRQRGRAVQVVLADSVMHALVQTFFRVNQGMKERKLPIRALKFYGHGQPACQIVGGGYNSANPSQVIRLDGQGKLLHRGSLAQLSTLLMPSKSWVELHGCWVAEGEEGELLLKRLAGVLHVPVIAGVTKQRPPAYAFEGIVCVAVPGRSRLMRMKINDYSLDSK